MELRITIGERSLMLILAVIIGVSMVGLVLAYGGSNPNTVGHSWGEIYCDKCIGTTNISDSAVTGAKIQDSSVTGAKIGCDNIFCRNPANGNIGIGTNSPQARLDIAGGLITISSCPSGTIKIYNGLCIDSIWRDSLAIPDAQSQCLSIGGHVCTYGELAAACKQGVAGADAASINGKWIGNIAGDDTAFYGNGGDCNNFEGISAKTTPRQYKCCFGTSGGAY